MGVIRIDGVIGDVFNTTDDIRLQIEELKLKPEDTLTVKINSGGGSVFDGMGIYNLLRSLPNKVITKGEGLVGSIATLILLAAEPEDTHISEVSMWMIHRALVSSGGNQEELDKQSKILKSIDETLISVYSERTGLERDVIEEMMSRETWLSGKEAVDMGFIKTLENPITAQHVADALNNLNTKQMSLKGLFKSFRNETEEEEEKKTVALTPEEELEKEKTNLIPDEDEEILEEPTPDEDEEILEEEEAKVTRAEFLELANGVSQVAAAVDSLIQNMASNESINAKVETKFKNLVTGLKASNSAPIVGEVQKTTYVDPMARHKAAMKDIESRTRNI